MIVAAESPAGLLETCTEDRSRVESARRGAGRVALRRGGGLIQVVGQWGQLVRRDVAEQLGLFGGPGWRERRRRGEAEKKGGTGTDSGKKGKRGKR
ncbi:MAG: hypothetical protein JXA57_16310 [Armatimonadetes bacterium]|nr:hypothetical protein [Armatimonadota bacterium]